MGKRRNTAKTGDQALYRSRTTASTSTDHDDDEDDRMYNKVDRFHNERDVIQLDHNDNEASSDDETEAVMDLGVGGGDDESSSEEESDEEDGEDAPGKEPPDMADSDNDDDDDEEWPMEDVRDWGKRKATYYSGDTADLEIGQDEEDAYLEEEAAKELQAARFAEMTDDDFAIDDEEDKRQEGQADKDGTVAVERDVTKLSQKEKQKLLDKQHPELLPLLSHFSDAVKDLNDNTMLAKNALIDGEDGTAEAVGATEQGQQYLLAKALLQSSTALNLAAYLLLKNDYASEEVDGSLIQSHPVIARLQKLNVLTQKLQDSVEDKVDGLPTQLMNLAKAARLMKSEEGMEESDKKSEGSNDSQVIEDNGEAVDEPSSTEEGNDDADSDEESVDHDALEKSVLSEARFGLRQSEIRPLEQRKRQRRAAPVDFGDEGVEEATKSLASTLNTIEQRTQSKKLKRKTDAEHLDDHLEDDGELRRGLEMMEAELGKLSDEGGDESGDDFDPELDNDDNEAGFYDKVAKKSKSRKAARKERYQVAPKYPRRELEIEGERAIGNAIMKNRGLVPHKSKLNRNPRVKKREQYRKAQIRRKGAVREVRDRDEGARYGGEETGIKSNLSRSRKLAG